MNEQFQTNSMINGQPGGASYTQAIPPVQREAVQRIVLAELSIQVLIEHSKVAWLWEEGFQEAGRLLEALPLPTAEFDLANRHLQNALSYARDGEFGAATFELRVLRGCIQRL